MTAIIFETQENGAEIALASDSADDGGLWQAALAHLDRALGTPLSRSIRASGTLRSVGESSIVIAKRNEARLWTASAGREDAEATILQAMNLQSAR